MIKGVTNGGEYVMANMTLDELSKKAKVPVDQLYEAFKNAYVHLVKVKKVDKEKAKPLAWHEVWQKFSPNITQEGEDLYMLMLDIGNSNDWTSDKHTTIQSKVNTLGLDEAEKQGYVKRKFNEAGDVIGFDPLYYWETKPDGSKNKNYGNILPAKSYLLNLVALVTRAKDKQIYYANVTLSGDVADPTNEAFIKPPFGKEIITKGRVDNIASLKKSKLQLMNVNINNFSYIESSDNMFAEFNVVEAMKQIPPLGKYNMYKFIDLDELPRVFKADAKSKDGVKQYDNRIFISVVYVSSNVQSTNNNSHRLWVYSSDEKFAPLAWVPKSFDVSSIGQGSQLVMWYKATLVTPKDASSSIEYQLQCRGFYPIALKYMEFSDVDMKIVNEMLADTGLNLGDDMVEDSVVDSLDDIDDDELDDILNER